jgi:hypothetical protein
MNLILNPIKFWNWETETMKCEIWELYLWKSVCLLTSAALISAWDKRPTTHRFYSAQKTRHMSSFTEGIKPRGKSTFTKRLTALQSSNSTLHRAPATCACNLCTHELKENYLYTFYESQKRNKSRSFDYDILIIPLH